MSKTTTLSPEKIELFRQILIHQAGLDPKATGQVYLACPIHGDITSDSFSANLDDATWTCHGACDTYGGLKKLQGLLLNALRQQEPDHCFDYVDETGALLYQQFPLMTCESYATMVADSSVRVSTIHVRLLQRLSRFDMTGGLVESRLISSWRRRSPHWWEVTWVAGTRLQGKCREMTRHESSRWGWTS